MRIVACQHSCCFLVSRMARAAVGTTQAAPTKGTRHAAKCSNVSKTQASLTSPCCCILGTACSHAQVSRRALLLPSLHLRQVVNGVKYRLRKWQASPKVLHLCPCTMCSPSGLTHHSSHRAQAGASAAGHTSSLLSWSSRTKSKRNLQGSRALCVRSR